MPKIKVKDLSKEQKIRRKIFFIRAKQAQISFCKRGCTPFKITFYLRNPANARRDFLKRPKKIQEWRDMIFVVKVALKKFPKIEVERAEKALALEKGEWEALHPQNQHKARRPRGSIPPKPPLLMRPAHHVVLTALRMAKEKAITPKELQKAVGNKTLHSCSDHLSRLRNKGYIEREKRGYVFYYRTTHKGIEFLAENTRPTKPVQESVKPRKIKKSARSYLDPVLLQPRKTNYLFALRFATTSDSFNVMDFRRELHNQGIDLVHSGPSMILNRCHGRGLLKRKKSKGLYVYALTEKGQAALKEIGGYSKTIESPISRPATSILKTSIVPNSQLRHTRQRAGTERVFQPDESFNEPW